MSFLSRTRQIVAGTCVGLGKFDCKLDEAVFDLVIIDEAGKSTPSELAVPLQSAESDFSG